MTISESTEELRVNNANLSHSTFNDVDLSNSSFTNVRFENVRFEDANLSNTTLLNVNLSQVDIQDCTVSGMKINGVLVDDLFAAYNARNKDGYHTLTLLFVGFTALFGYLAVR